MRTDVAFPERIELSILRPENRLVLENHPDHVVIRAPQRSISPSQKSFLIRYLAAEGYIPERYQWFDDSEPEFRSGLKWLVDNSRSRVRPLAGRHVLPQNIRGFVYTVLAWLTIATMILVYELR
jgi:hypothetical protein